MTHENAILLVEEDGIRGYEPGCNSYIRKPADFTRLAESVRNPGLYWMALNEPPLPAREE